MKTLWLTKDESYTVFDTRPSKDILEIPFMPEYEVEMHLTDAEEADYVHCREAWYRWQNKMSEHYDKAHVRKVY
jgi:hypothetical protein